MQQKSSCYVLAHSSVARAERGRAFTSAARTHESLVMESQTLGGLPSIRLNMVVKAETLS